MQFAYLLPLLTATIWLLAGLLFVPAQRGLVAGIYLMLGNLRFKGSFGLMLHWTDHSSAFAKA